MNERAKVKRIFYVKNYPNPSEFVFSLKNKNLGAHFLVTLILKLENFKIGLPKVSLPRLMTLVSIQLKLTSLS